MHEVVLLPGDGIGVEIAACVKEAFRAFKIPVVFHEATIGAKAVEDFGTPLPESSQELILKYQVALKGPTTTPIGYGHKSANVLLRQNLDLFACVRPVFSIPNIKTRFENVDLVIFRENTEGLYIGQEVELQKGCIVSMKLATKKACERIVNAAFEYAHTHKRKKVTLGHKANILKKGDGLMLQVASEIAQKQENQNIEFESVIIDALCMKLVTNPNPFDVLVMENLYGDILSDLCAGLVGGLGVVPGANLGPKAAVFEAVHGTAPDIAGQNKANPTALLLSACMMLEYLKEHQSAKKLQQALRKTFEQNIKTPDLGGSATTKEFMDALIQNDSFFF